MAIPSWTYPSNTNLGTYSERTQVSIPILVFDTDDYSTLETKQFENAVDSTTLPNYADDNFFWVKSTGLAQTSWLGQPTNVNKYSPLAQSYVFQIPRDKTTINGESTSVTARRETNTPSTGFFGVAIDGVPFKSPNSGIIATIGGKNYTENAAIYPIIAPYYFDKSQKINIEKSFKKYLSIDPAIVQQQFSLDESGNPQLGIDNGFWNNTFKIRITSKESGKAFDINLNFTKKIIETI